MRFLSELALGPIIQEEGLETTTMFPRPQCMCYEPLSQTEGTCTISRRVVNIEGCNNPNNCKELNRGYQE